MIRHHACETANHYCTLCDTGSYPMAVLATTTCRTTLGAIWLTARLNTRQGNRHFAWHRFGKTVQLD